MRHQALSSQAWEIKQPGSPCNHSLGLNSSAKCLRANLVFKKNWSRVTWSCFVQHLSDALQERQGREKSSDRYKRNLHIQVLHKERKDSSGWVLFYCLLPAIPWGLMGLVVCMSPKSSNWHNIDPEPMALCCPAVEMNIHHQPSGSVCQSPLQHEALENLIALVGKKK